MNYFKSTYTPGIKYAPNWYGQLDIAPTATVIYYDDVNGLCIGFMESDLPAGVVAITEDVATESRPVGEGQWFGDALIHRWDAPPQVQS